MFAGMIVWLAHPLMLQLMLILKEGDDLSAQEGLSTATSHERTRENLLIKSQMVVSQAMRLNQIN